MLICPENDGSFDQMEHIGQQRPLKVTNTTLVISVCTDDLANLITSSSNVSGTLITLSDSDNILLYTQIHRHTWHHLLAGSPFSKASWAGSKFYFILFYFIFILFYFIFLSTKKQTHTLRVEWTESDDLADSMMEELLLFYFIFFY